MGNFYNNTVSNAVLTAFSVGMTLNYCRLQQNTGGYISLDSASPRFTLTYCVFDKELPGPYSAQIKEGCYGNLVTSTFSLYYFDTEPCPAVISPSSTPSISGTPTRTMTSSVSHSPTPTKSMSPRPTPTASVSYSACDSPTPLSTPCGAAQPAAATGAIIGGAVGGSAVVVLGGIGAAILWKLHQIAKLRRDESDGDGSHDPKVELTGEDVA
jgi:hypothetical protein